MIMEFVYMKRKETYGMHILWWMILAFVLIINRKMETSWDFHVQLKKRTVQSFFFFVAHDLSQNIEHRVWYSFPTIFLSIIWFVNNSKTVQTERKVVFHCRHNVCPRATNTLPIQEKAKENCFYFLIKPGFLWRDI